MKPGFQLDNFKRYSVKNFNKPAYVLNFSSGVILAYNMKSLDLQVLSLFRECLVLVLISLCLFQVGVGTCGIGGQPMTQFTAPEKLVYRK